MAKKVLFLLVFAVLASGVFAQEAGLSFESLGYDTSLAVPVMLQGDFNGGFELAPLAEGSSASSSGGFLTGNRFAAGALNLPLGLWSWLNRDWLGGALTAGLEGFGIGLAVYAVVSNDLVYVLGGIGLIIGGAVYGFRRGWSQCKNIQQAGSLAEALGENPLKHISLAAAPNGKGGVAGALAWRSAW
jgi:hypothetical protein